MSYKVDNAIILAAGMSSRFVPLSYEKPKALLKVKNEILIERQIRQLKDAGINDITIVVGYLKEQFFYLEEKFDVSIVVNEDYYKYNNTSSLIRVLDKLQNTYICSADNYFTENVFNSEEPYAFYSSAFIEDQTKEYVLTYNKDNLITDVSIGGTKNNWIMIGHVFFSKDVSDKFKSLLLKEYEKLEVKNNLWEDFYRQHINELPLYIKKFQNNIIWEFDSINDLRKFDNNYIDNIDSSIINNICSVFNCPPSQIRDFTPIKEGLTNTSFWFSLPEGKFVYRHPGKGTEKYINRVNEYNSEVLAKHLELDNTFFYMDKNEGWKISHYCSNARILDYHNLEDVKKAISLMRKLHKESIQVEYTFDIWKKTNSLLDSVHQSGKDNFQDFKELKILMTKVYEIFSSENNIKCLCHCDCYAPNFMIHDDKMDLIDWEYSGMDDPAIDLGTFIACSDYSFDEAIQILNLYHEAELPAKQLRHYLAAISIASYYWFTWALYQEVIGKHTDEWVYIWYKTALKYAHKTINLQTQQLN